MRPDAPLPPTVDELTSFDALAATSSEWWELWKCAPDASAMQTPAWLLAWWHHFAGDGLWTLAVRRQSTLLGLAPFFIYTDPSERTRQVTFVGNGVSDHLDLLCAASHEDEVAAAVLSYLATHADEWDSCDFRDLPPESPLLRADVPEGLRAAREVDSICPSLALPPGVDAVESVVPGRLAKNLRYYRRRAEKLGPVRFEEAGPDSIDRLYSALLRLHGARWSARGEPGMLAGETMRSFLHEVAAALLDRGMLRLYALWVGRKMAAVDYCIYSRDRTLYYLGGFDPRLSACSPGTLLLGYAVARAMDDGATEFDFLRGREPYKYAWGAEERPSFRLRLEPERPAAPSSNP